ncbi:Putative ripening-related protein 2 [Linum grandiflorum]
MKIISINLIFLLLIKPSKQTVSIYSNITASIEETDQTGAILTLNGFEKGGSGGGASECDGNYHSDDENIVALSTGWYDHERKRRCSQFVKIMWKGKTVRAKVVDECDSARGCDKDHDFQPPCPNNVVDASKAVWKALGVPSEDWGSLKVTWSDA